MYHGCGSDLLSISAGSEKIHVSNVPSNPSNWVNGANFNCCVILMGFMKFSPRLSVLEAAEFIEGVEVTALSMVCRDRGEDE